MLEGKCREVLALRADLTAMSIAHSGERANRQVLEKKYEAALTDYNDLDRKHEIVLQKYTILQERVTKLLH